MYKHIHIGRTIISKLTYKLGGLLLPLPIGFRMKPQLGLYVGLGEMLGRKNLNKWYQRQVEPNDDVDGVPSIRPRFDGISGFR